MDRWVNITEVKNFTLKLHILINTIFYLIFHVGRLKSKHGINWTISILHLLRSIANKSKLLYYILM